MKRALLAATISVCLVIFSAATAHANDDCQFVLGFATLRDLIGHDIVGECLDNEHYNDIGDSNQHTTGGLLAWRKADNWTAFTDGYRTWVNGPNGLQQRLNTERFEWEADYAKFAPASETPAQQVDQEASSPSLDPTLAHAFHILRTTWNPAGEGIYQLFLAMDASVQFGPMASTSQWQSMPNRIIINERYRTESPETLAHTLIWPTLGLASYTDSGNPQSWEACIERIIAQHTAQASWWLSLWGANGNPIPTQLEQSANNNLRYLVDDVLDRWVRSDDFYRLSCSRFGEPPTKIPRDAVVGGLAHKLTLELGHKDGSAGFYLIRGFMSKSVFKLLWLYEGKYIMVNPGIGNLDVSLPIGNDVEREGRIRYWLNNPAEARQTAQEVRAWLYAALSGRATGSIQDTGNAWLNSLLRSDPNGFVFWVTGMEEAFWRILAGIDRAEQYAPIRQRVLENQIGIFLYENAGDPDRTTGPALLPDGWLQ